MAERAAAIDRFLAAHGYAGCLRAPLAGDASARRYERLRGSPGPAILMDAPPSTLDVRPFLRIAAWLLGQSFSAPRILAAAPDQGLVLLEDLGDGLLNRCLAEGAAPEPLYQAALDTLLAIQAAPPPPDLPPYDDAKLMTELGLLTEWYAQHLPAAAKADYLAIWQDLLPLVRVGPACLVYVDYHADNLLWLPERTGTARIGLLDFQDARLGPPAYDLVSLLEDARRDVPPALAAAMVERYLASRPELDPAAFKVSYAVLGAQRNCKILGLFTRLARRDHKPHYLPLIDRVRGYLLRDLAQPALAPLGQWLARHLELNIAS